MSYVTGQTEFSDGSTSGSHLGIARVQAYEELESPEISIDIHKRTSLSLSKICNRPADDARRINSLTGREIEILQQLGKGFSMKGVSRNLDIAPGTVKWHVNNLYGKLDASSREDALCKARPRKLILRRLLINCGSTFQREKHSARCE